jgi:predicted pyridoxine 5'-phosphate oxidase superfamily flavin-nucleotide-binding protein
MTETPMTSIYGNAHRELQDDFSTRPLADRLEAVIVKNEFDDESKGFIESRNMFFLSTIDHTGRPTVSYKGGDVGFVKIVDATTLAFPSYDGNGMFMSMGNIVEQSKVGMLFIAFDKPHRIRVHGNASIDRNDPLLAEYKEAELIVRVKLTDLWQNCPRYIHRQAMETTSRYVPQAARETPLAGWKQTDLVQDVISAKDAEKAREMGVIGIGDWLEKVKVGDPTA